MDNDLLDTLLSAFDEMKASNAKMHREKTRAINNVAEALTHIAMALHHAPSPRRLRDPFSNVYVAPRAPSKRADTKNKKEVAAGDAQG